VVRLEVLEMTKQVLTEELLLLALLVLLQEVQVAQMRLISGGLVELVLAVM
jgi:hypothetical protein